MDTWFTLFVLAVAGALILPALLFVRWLELRAERRAAEHTPAE